MIWKSQKKNKKKATGADEFLSVLIYILIKAKPEKIASNLAYIRDFRSKSRLCGESEYYFTAFDSGIRFIQNLKADQLKISKEEFERRKEECSKKALERRR